MSSRTHMYILFWVLIERQWHIEKHWIATVCEWCVRPKGIPFNFWWMKNFGRSLLFFTMWIRFFSLIILYAIILDEIVPMGPNLMHHSTVWIEFIPQNEFMRIYRMYVYSRSGYWLACSFVCACALFHTIHSSNWIFYWMHVWKPNLSASIFI